MALYRKEFNMSAPPGKQETIIKVSDEEEKALREAEAKNPPQERPPSLASRIAAIEKLLKI